jgi:hypothetical protein
MYFEYFMVRIDTRRLNATPELLSDIANRLEAPIWQDVPTLPTNVPVAKHWHFGTIKTRFDSPAQLHDAIKKLEGLIPVEAVSVHVVGENDGFTPTSWQRLLDHAHAHRPLVDA